MSEDAPLPEAGQELPPDAPPFEEADSSLLLSSADALDSEEASRLLAADRGNVVVWAGERSSGKTTLTCEIYERQRKPKAPVTFAGSQTLLALEQVTHPARAASGRRIKETRRTERDPEGREILHLALIPPGEQLINLLIGDLPGEVFRELRDNVGDVEDLPLLERADKLALVADGARLRDQTTRAAVTSGVRQLLTRLRAAGLPHPRTELALVVTMWDQVADDATVKAYWEPREKSLLELIRSVDLDAPLFRVAARAPADWNGQSDMDALRDWLLAKPRPATDPQLRTFSWPSWLVPRLRRPKRLRGRR